MTYPPELLGKHGLIYKIELLVFIDCVVSLWL